jgi:hypothetical protein
MLNIPKKKTYIGLLIVNSVVYYFAQTKLSSLCPFFVFFNFFPVALYVSESIFLYDFSHEANAVSTRFEKRRSKQKSPKKLPQFFFQSLNSLILMRKISNLFYEVGIGHILFYDINFFFFFLNKR